MKANQKQNKERPQKAPVSVSDQLWVRDNWNTISKRYSRQWIAVFHGSVIANGTNPEIVQLNAKEIAGNVPMVMKYVEKGIYIP